MLIQPLHNWDYSWGISTYLQRPPCLRAAQPVPPVPHALLCLACADPPLALRCHESEKRPERARRVCRVGWQQPGTSGQVLSSMDRCEDHGGVLTIGILSPTRNIPWAKLCTECAFVAIWAASVKFQARDSLKGKEQLWVTLGKGTWTAVGRN